MDCVSKISYSNQQPLWRLFVLHFVSCGLYIFYWFYRNCSQLYPDNDTKIRPWLRTICLCIPFVGSILLWFQFVDIKKFVASKSLPSFKYPGWLALFYLFGAILMTAESSGIVIILLGLFISTSSLLKVQQTLNKYWDYRQINLPIKKISWIEIVISLIMPALILLNFLPESKSNFESPEPSVNQQHISQNWANLEKIAASVVQIYCISPLEDNSIYRGSGVVINTNGLILTNSHIIPQDEKNLKTPDCLVLLPNPNTGQPEKTYWATPLVLNNISEKYDLAFMKIFAAAPFDEHSDSFKEDLNFEKDFVSIDLSNGCDLESIDLGEPIRIYGYPSISGGYSLTVTEGIISSFPGDGLITTSAKISSGNSGGLAISQKGCAIGIPSMVMTDEHESLGLIISMNIIHSFAKEVVNAMDNDEDGYLKE